MTGEGGLAKSVSEETKSQSQGRGIQKAGKCRAINRAGQGIVRVGYKSRRPSEMDF